MGASQHSEAMKVVDNTYNPTSIRALLRQSGILSPQHPFVEVGFKSVS